MLTSSSRISSKITAYCTLTIAILEDNAHQVSQLVRIFKHQVQWPHFGIHKLALFNTNRENKEEITPLYWKSLSIISSPQKLKGGGGGSRVRVSQSILATICNMSIYVTAHLNTEWTLYALLAMAPEVSLKSFTQLWHCCCSYFNYKDNCMYTDSLLSHQWMLY